MTNTFIHYQNFLKQIQDTLLRELCDSCTIEIRIPTRNRQGAKTYSDQELAFYKALNEYLIQQNVEIARGWSCNYRLQGSSAHVMADFLVQQYNQNHQYFFKKSIAFIGVIEFVYLPTDVFLTEFASPTLSRENSDILVLVDELKNNRSHELFLGLMQLATKYVGADVMGCMSFYETVIENICLEKGITYLTSKERQELQLINRHQRLITLQWGHEARRAAEEKQAQEREKKLVEEKKSYIDKLIREVRAFYGDTAYNSCDINDLIEAIYGTGYDDENSSQYSFVETCWAVLAFCADSEHSGNYSDYLLREIFTGEYNRTRTDRPKLEQDYKQWCSIGAKRLSREIYAGKSIRKSPTTFVNKILLALYVIEAMKRHYRYQPTLGTFKYIIDGFWLLAENGYDLTLMCKNLKSFAAFAKPFLTEKNAVDLCLYIKAKLNKTYRIQRDKIGADQYVSADLGEINRQSWQSMMGGLTSTPGSLFSDTPDIAASSTAASASARRMPL